MDVELDEYALLDWDGHIQVPVEADEDERTAAGDDHAARPYLGFLGANGEEHAMEIVWGKEVLGRDDRKHIDFRFGLVSFPHYTANGGRDQAGR